MLHYLEFKVSPEDTRMWMGNLVQAVHGAHKALGSRLAIGFPDWREASEGGGGRATCHADIGSRLRVFGTELALMAFSVSPVPAKLRRTGAAQISLVQAVPAVRGWERYLRDRTQERQSPGEAARRARRRLARGTGTRVGGEQPRLPVRSSVTLDISSLSEAAVFPLRIARVPQSEQGGDSNALNGYGLSTSPEGAVPSF